MKSSFLKRATPHLIAIGIFLVLAIVYCQPALQGKVVNQHDVLGWKGMAQQSFEYKEKHGHFPLWSNSMFGGMPGYTFAMDQKYPVSVGYLDLILTLGLPKPISFFFAACLCFYFLCQVLRIRPWISIMAAIGFAYSTFDAIIIAVGHETQMHALALAPAVIGSFLLLLQRKYWWGLALLAIFSGIQIGTQHLQIVYYTLLILGMITICYLIQCFKQGKIKTAFVSLALAALAGIIGFTSYAVSMLPLQEYAKETMRGGKSELMGDASNKTKGGLDKDYAFQWSYGKNETFTLLVPNIYGGGSGASHFSGPTRFSEKLAEAGVPEENAVQMENVYAYWGAQTLGTSGPVYLGAVICFLFILGLVYVKSWHKSWIVAAAMLGILMAWGKHFSVFNYFLFDYLPFYSKFRAPTMALIIPQITFPLLGAMAVDQLLTDQSPLAERWKKFRLAAMITGGLLVILALFYFSSDFRGENDTKLRDSFAMQMSQGNPQAQQQAQSSAQSFVRALQDDRRALFGADLLRTFVLIALTIILIGAYLKNKIKAMVVMLGLTTLTAYDLLAVGKRYLSNENFVEPEEFNGQLAPTAADQQIMADPHKPFRVFDNSDPNGPFNSSRAAYFHNSIGGYSPAKLGLYQDLIENQLSKGNMQVFDMLNTKYFIVENPQNRQTMAQLNPNAFGPVWLAKGIRYVTNADQEMKALDSTNLKDTAVVQEKYRSTIKSQPRSDSAAGIKLIENGNDVVRYAFNSSTNQFAVFSEIYYPHGWNVYVDGNKSDYVKTNYVLRGMYVPAGKHDIEFRFEPRTYALGNLLTLLSTLLAYVLLIIAIIMEVRQKKPVAQS